MEASLEPIYKTTEVHDCETKLSKLVGIVSATDVSYIY